MIKNIVKYFGLLVLFDALIGGGISAALRSDGWTLSDQGANNSYQLGFFIVIISVLAMMWKNGMKFESMMIILLKAGYIEDTLYYVFTFFLKLPIKLVSGFPVTWSLFPKEIAGWFGWMSRVFLGEYFAVPFLKVIMINIGTLVVVYFLFRRKDRMKWLGYTN